MAGQGPRRVTLQESIKVLMEAKEADARLRRSSESPGTPSCPLPTMASPKPGSPRARRPTEDAERLSILRSPSAATRGSSGGSAALRSWLATHLRAASGDLVARRARDHTRFKALARTPYPMILARIKLLLDRLQAIVQSGLPGARRTSAVDPRRSSASPAAFAPPPNLWGGEAEAGQTDGQDSTRMTMEKVVEELGVTFSFVSDFLRQVPEETRLEASLSVKLEVYKKDQSVYKIGDDADKFYIILTGTVEVWMHPHDQPRVRTVISTYRKGSSFGEQGILNNEPRNEVVTPTSNCTFLTMGRADFLEVFGTFFRSQQATMFDFFARNVPIFSMVSREDMQQVVGNMLVGNYLDGKEWEPNTEGQIYFIKEGACTLEALDRKAVIKVTALPSRIRPRTGDGGEEVPNGDPLPVSQTGVLANVAVVDGRVVGSLGHEEELRRLRRALIPRRTIATLEMGNYFGGGPTVLGEGEMQSCLKVMAVGALQVYHMPINLFFKQASPDVVRSLRDDVAFKLTYYYGRLGTIGLDTVVGHAESTLQGHDNAPPGSPSNVSKSQVDLGRQSANGRQGAASARGDGGKRGTRTRSKTAYVAGELGPEVQRVLAYMSELRGMDPGWQPDLASTLAAPSPSFGANGAVAPVNSVISPEERLGAAAVAAMAEQHTSPAERFWSHTASGSSKGTALAPLLTHIYPQGLAPLADKIDELIENTVRRTETLLAANRGVPLKPSETCRLDRIRTLSRMSSRASSSGGGSGGLDSAPSDSSTIGGGSGGYGSGASTQHTTTSASAAGELAAAAAGHPRSRLSMSAWGGGGGGGGGGPSSSMKSPRTTPTSPTASSGGATDMAARFGNLAARVATATTEKSESSGARLERLMTLGGSGGGGFGGGTRSGDDYDEVSSPTTPRSPGARLRSAPTSSRGAGALFSPKGGYDGAGSFRNPSFSGDLADGGPSTWSAASVPLSGSQTARSERHAHPGSLAAAGVLWEKTSELGAGPPAMRQCLTYGEIKVRAEQKRAIFAAVKSQSARAARGGNSL